MDIKGKIYNKNISYVLLYVFVFAIPFKVNFGNLGLILATVYSVFFITKSSVNKLKYAAFYFPIVFFLITVLSSLFSKNIMLGLVRTDLEFLPIMIVILLIGKDLTKEWIKRLFFIFYASTFLFSLILVVISTYNIYSGTNSGTFHNFTLPYDQHPVYFSIYISLALCYMVIYQKEIIFKWHYVYKVISVLILSYALILAASKAVIFFDFILLIIYIFSRHKHFKERLIGFSILLVIGWFALNNTLIKERFSDGLTMSSEISEFSPTNDFSKKKLFSYNEKEDISDLELRYIFAKIAIYHAYKDHKLLFGYGQGDAQNFLDYYYYSYNLGPNWYEDYNVHNQYIHILITYGILALILFLVYLAFSLYVAIINSNYLYLFFLLICSFVFLFEVTLVRNKGIVFFYFFNTLFLAHYLNFEDSNTRDKRNTKLSRWF